MGSLTIGYGGVSDLWPALDPLCLAGMPFLASVGENGALRPAVSLCARVGWYPEGPPPSQTKR